MVRMSEADPRRRRAILGALIAVILVVGVTTAVVVGSGTGTGTGTTSPRLPTGVSALGDPYVLNPAAPATVPTVDLYVDFQCPICARFEQAFGEQLTVLTAKNEIRMVVHTMSFLDDSLKNDSSKRAASAAYCAADQGAFAPYFAAVFAGAPAVEGTGWTDAELVRFGTTAGISGSGLEAFTACVQAKAYLPHVAAVETSSEKAGVNGTPTIKVNGTVLDLATLSEQSLADQVKAATR
jgi:protein-disulfide isomerase